MPKATSCWPVSHISSCAQAACSTVLTVVWHDRASSPRARVVCCGHSKRRATPRRPSPNRRGGPTRSGCRTRSNTSRQAASAASTIPIGQPGDEPAVRTRARAAAARGSWRISPAAGSASTSRRPRCGDWSAPTGAGLSAVRISATRKAGWSARSQTAARSAAHSRSICSSISTPSRRRSSTYRHGGTGSPG